MNVKILDEFYIRAVGKDYSAATFVGTAEK